MKRPNKNKIQKVILEEVQSELKRKYPKEDLKLNQKELRAINRLAAHEEKRVNNFIDLATYAEPEQNPRRKRPCHHNFKLKIRKSFW